MRGRRRIWLAGLGVWLLALPAHEAVAAEPAASSGAAVSPKQAATSAAPNAAPDGGKTEQGVSMFPIKGDKPLSIRSDELDAVESDGRKRLLFTNNVHIEQGDLQVNSDKLEAFYPPGGSQPDKLVANGHVVVTQLQKRMLCETATYFQPEDRLLCVGNAELQQGDDRVRGKEIEIFIKQNRVKVRGGATVNVTPSKDDKKQPAQQADAAPVSPPAKTKR